MFAEAANQVSGWAEYGIAGLTIAAAFALIHLLINKGLTKFEAASTKHSETVEVIHKTHHDSIETMNGTHTDAIKQMHTDHSDSIKSIANEHRAERAEWRDDNLKRDDRFENIVSNILNNKP